MNANSFNKTIDSRVPYLSRHHFSFKCAMTFTLGLVLSGCMATGAYAGNPWARAVGEAIDLHSTTKALRNHIQRTCPHSPAARLAFLQEQYACQLVDIVKAGIPQIQIEQVLQIFAQNKQQLCKTIEFDPHVQRDHGVKGLVRAVDTLYTNLVNDLGRCNDWCDHHIPHPLPTYQPVFPEFGSYSQEGVYPNPARSLIEPYQSDFGYGGNWQNESGRPEAIMPRVPSLIFPTPAVPSSPDWRNHEPRNSNPQSHVDPQFWDGAVEL